MQVHTLPKQIGISLLLAAFLNSACALPHPTGQPQFNPEGAPPVAVQPSPVSTPSAMARVSPEDAAARAVNTLTPTAEGYALQHPHYTATFRADSVTFQPKRGEVHWQWHLTAVETAAGPLEGIKAGEVRPEQPAPYTVVYRRGVLDEQYVARKGSIEQQFVISQPLALQGADLQIRGQVQSGGILEIRDQRWVWRGEDKSVWLGSYTASGG